MREQFVIDWEFIFTQASLSLLLIMIISLITLRFTLTRRLKKHIDEIEEFYFDSGTIDLGFVNTIFFAGACAFPQFKKLKRHKLFVSENIDVRQFAKCHEVVLSYIYSISLILFSIASIFYAATDYFEWIQWKYADP